MIKPAILLIDDAMMMRQFITIFLADKYEVTACESAEEAIQLIECGYRPNLVISDLELPKMSGLDLIHTLQLTMPYTPLVVISGSKDSKTRLAALAAGADDFLTKPFHPAELAVRISKLLSREVEALPKVKNTKTLFSGFRRMAAAF